METFEHFGIPAESTTGVEQLSKVRATLTPYVGRLDFKYRVLLSHKLLSGLKNSDKDPTVSVAPGLIPNFKKWLFQTNTFYMYLASKRLHGLQRMLHTFSVFAHAQSLVTGKIINEYILPRCQGDLLCQTQNLEGIRNRRTSLNRRIGSRRFELGIKLRLGQFFLIPLSEHERTDTRIYITLHRSEMF